MNSLPLTVKAWSAVITKLGFAYPPPGSKIGEMSNEDVVMMARVWADELSDVPPEAIEELHRRVMKGRKAPYCPNVGDYRATWNEWDYWAEVNRVEVNDYKALPQAMGAADTPRWVQLFQECGPVLCKCGETVGANGVFVYSHPAALMTVGELMEAGRDADYKGLDFTAFGGYQDRFAKGLPRYWVCADGKCDFCVNADKLDSVLPRKRARDGEGFSAVSSVMDSVGRAQRKSTAEPAPAPSGISDAELIEALTACGFPVESKGVERSTEFGRYVIRQLGVAGLNERDCKTLWPEFKALPTIAPDDTDGVSVASAGVGVVMGSRGVVAMGEL